MKTAYKISILFVLILLLNQSCRKHDRDEREPKRVSVSLKAGESHTYTIPADMQNDGYSISQQPTHAAVSVMSKTSEGRVTYQYTPVAGYSGTDEARLATANKSTGRCGSDEEKREIILQYSITDPEGD